MLFSLIVTLLSARTNIGLSRKSAGKPSGGLSVRDGLGRALASDRGWIAWHVVHLKQQPRPEPGLLCCIEVLPLLIQTIAFD